MGAIAWTKLIINIEYRICTAPEPFDTLVSGLVGGVDDDDILNNDDVDGDHNDHHCDHH